jgi:hypothetical protein
VEKELSSKCAGQGSRKGAKGKAREIAANQQDRRTDLEVCKAWLFVVFVFSSGGPLSQDGSPRLILINQQYWFSLRGFSRGFYPEISCAMCLVSSFLLPL